MNERVILNPLRFRHALEHRETGPGFASRLAAMNGRLMGEMFQHIGIKPHAVDNGVEAAVRMVAALGNVDADRLVAFTPKPADGKRQYHVAGEVLGPLGINRTFFRYCPHCVLEDLKRFDGPKHARPWLRLEWTIMHYRSCHHHNACLVDAQPVRRRFQPFDFSETMQGLLPTMEQIAAATTPSKPSCFEKWLIARTDGEKDPGNFLDTLPLYVGAEWCEALGVSMLHPAKVATSRLTAAEWAAAADEGFRISCAGEQAIKEALGRLTAAQKRTRGIIGPRDTYGYAFGLLQKTIHDPAFDPLRKIVREQAMHALPWKIGTDMLGVTIEENTLVTVTTAAQMSGADRRTIRKVFKRKGIAAGDIDAGVRNHRILVRAEEIQPVLQKLKGAITAPAAMQMLGIDRRQLNALVAAGALDDASGLKRETWEEARYAVEDIEAMMAQLLAGAVEVERPTERQVNIIKARHMAGATAVEVLKLVFGGKLAWKGRLVGKADFHSVLIDADEVTRLVREAAPAMTNFLFAELEQEIIGLNKNSVPHLVKLGKLVEDEEYSPRARRLVPVITRASVDEFRKQYVTAGELCQTYELHHKQVRAILERAGIDEVCDAKAVKTTIYDRLKIEAAARETKTFWVYRRQETSA